MNWKAFSFYLDRYSGKLLRVQEVYYKLFANVEVWWLKFKWLSNVTPRPFSNLVLEVLFSLIFTSKLYFYIKACDTFWERFSFPYFQSIQKQILRIFLIDLLLPLEFFLSIKCYCLHSLQSLCHYEKEMYHKRNILNKSGPSIDPLVLVHQLRYPTMSFIDHFNHLPTLS